MDQKIRKERREKRIKFVLWKTLTMLVVLFVLAFLCVQYSPVLSSFAVKETKAEAKQWAYALVFLAVPPLLYSQIHDLDEEKRKRVAKKHKEKRYSYPEAIREAFFSSECWLDAGMFLAFLYLLPSGNSVVRALFFKADLSLPAIYLWKILLYLLPMTVCLLVIEGAFARDMHRLWRMEGMLSDPQGEPILSAVPQKKIRMHLLYLLLISLLLPSVIPIFNFVFALVVAALPYYKFLTVMAVFGVLVWLYRWFFGMAKRKKEFRQTLEKICRERGYRLEWKAKPFDGIYACTCREEFTVEMASFRFSGVFLPVHSRNSNLYFWENPVYRFEKRILFLYFFFPSHPLNLKALAQPEGNVKRVVVLSQEPKMIAYGDEDASREIACGDTVRDFTVHHAVSFCHFVDRYHLFR